jgi:hypothetical protein
VLGGICCINLGERCHLGDLGVLGRILVKWILINSIGVLNGSFWMKIETGGLFL